MLANLPPLPPFRLCGVDMDRDVTADQQRELELGVSIKIWPEKSGYYHLTLFLDLSTVDQ